MNYMIGLFVYSNRSTNRLTEGPGHVPNILPNLCLSLGPNFPEVGHSTSSSWYTLCVVWRGFIADRSAARVGSGTGLFTRTLLAHPQWQDCIASIHAVEPSEGMRRTFGDKTRDDRVSCHDGTFTETGEQDGWADAVIIAQVGSFSMEYISSYALQAFHWAHPHYDATMKEIARVLKPRGTAFFIWNMEDR
jgi:Methyltransferase domain